MVPAALWHELLRRGTRRDYRTNEHLLVQGAPGRSLLVLTAGRVKVVHTDSDGGVLLLALNGPGDLLGEMAARDGGPRSATVVALEPCVAYLLTAEAFDHVLRAHGGRAEFDRYFVRKMRGSNQRTSALAHRSPRQRLIGLLLEVIELAGEPPEEPVVVPFSQTLLAQALGVSRSLVAQLVAQLRAEGVLLADRRLLVADLARLRRLAAAADRLTR
ncbi:cAMP-binding domain of CRP or a regulatory subunit of cAMP-dependent protein kinases [Goodfellowiella coeruleoviolacea]|uniref:cAMP-binding domain of CRP or a regulatory subunit of cAMP-dependent protein kinases n=2 Tax=Goodfellowiella coeruleoviolacea TaxID=334858 RepID=A0AAE3GME9_9PSEU|nr:cAMP-binding domain of CRP or a regulatory subunit of cAMP-dependent protein kinases [Goodfellowiella coeruleoviolacea]